MRKWITNKLTDLYLRAMQVGVAHLLQLFRADTMQHTAGVQRYRVTRLAGGGIMQHYQLEIFHLGKQEWLAFGMLHALGGNVADLLDAANVGQYVKDFDRAMVQADMAKRRTKQGHGVEEAEEAGPHEVATLNKKRRWNDGK